MPVDYYTATRRCRLVNLASQLETPTLVRIDINVPLKNGRIVENSLRLDVYAHVLELLSEYAGLVVLAHQGRPGEPELIPLKQHWIILRKLLPSEIDIEYIPVSEMLTKETREKILKLDVRQIILMDNVRLLEDEYYFSSEAALYRFFKGVIKTCVNDAIPVWHRSHTSLMMLPYIGKTYVGIRSTYELKAIWDINHSSETCGIIIGGSKFEKADYMFRLLERMDAFTGGIPAQLVLLAKGYDIGVRNEEYVKTHLKPEQLQIAKEIVRRFDVKHPIDFIVLEDKVPKVVPSERLGDTNGLIVDIGPETVYLYADMLQEKEIRIRAGPLGMYELGFGNGLKLTKMIAGNGLIFVGGDTTQELVMYNMEEVISRTGGLVLISGNAFLHGLSGFNYPSVDLIIKQAENSLPPIQSLS
ncbi:MAG: phosphoglycerate kinase [Thermoproteota archaeon]|nr:MAG: phosphoglycerate kinase [Candidatus Korarchaeota archaeon]